MKITDYLKLNVPELTDSPPDITKLSENFPKIDANAKSIEEQINNLAANKADLVDGKVPSNQLPNIEVPVQSVNNKTGAVVLTKSDIGLGNVDNTADSAKAVLSATKLVTPRAINGVAFDGTQNITVVDGTKAPTNHASTGTGYGVGNVSNYGHVKVRNDLTGTETEGVTVSPAQIKLINDKIQLETAVLLADFNLSTSARTDIKSYISTDYDKYVFKVTYTNFTVSTAITSGSTSASVALFASNATITSSPSASASIISQFELFADTTPKSITLNQIKSIVYLKGSDYKRNDSYYSYMRYDSLLNNNLYFTTRFDFSAYCGLYIPTNMSVSGTVNIKIYGQNIWR